MSSRGPRLAANGPRSEKHGPQPLDGGGVSQARRLLFRLPDSESTWIYVPLRANLEPAPIGIVRASTDAD